MAVLNRAQWKAKIPTVIFTNGTKQINAAAHGPLLEDDLADSFLNLITDKPLLNLRDYQPARSYEVGEGCYESAVLYRANTITTPGAFNAGEWDAIGGGGGGESNTVSNLGAGEGVFFQKTGVDFELKSFVAGTNVSLVADANTITINATDTGEANTASNQGATGQVIFKQKSGVDFELHKVNGINSLSSALNADVVEFQLDGDADTPGNDKYYGTNAGGTKGFFDLPSGGGGVTGANNGLNLDGANAQLGGALIEATSVSAISDTFTLDFSSNAIAGLLHMKEGGLGVGWNNWVQATTLSLINVKSKTDAITNNTYTQYDTLGTTRTARISDEGSAFFNSQVSVGEDRLNSGQALSVVCDDNAVGIRVWANTGSTTTNNVVFDLNKDRTVGLGGNYDAAYSEPIQAKNNMTVVRAGQPFFTIRTTNGNSSRVFWSGSDATKDWGLLAATGTTSGFIDASIWEFKNVNPAFTTNILWGKFVKEEDTDTNNGEEWIEWRKNKVVNITGTSFTPSNLDTDASIDFIDTNKGVKINGGTTAQRPTGSERMAYVTSDIGANGSLSIYSNGAWRDINL